MPTILVDHYFDSVCTDFSALDGPSNPFRSAVEALWNGWEPMYYTVQSMAAVYLVNDIPHIRIVGLHLQFDVYASYSLHQSSTAAENGDVQADDKTHLTMLMLGHTTSWHRGEDVG